MDLELGGRVVVVTGASRGIGLATAALLVAEGASVFAVARDGDALEEAVGGLDGPGRAHPSAADVTAPGTADRVAAECAANLGEPYALVNGAGTSEVRALADLTDDDWQGQWDLNVTASRWLMAALAPGMAERGEGRIVNVASTSGKRVSATNVAYSVTKAAQLALSRAYADEYAGRGVLVNSVSPGPVATGLWMDEGGLADQTAAAQGISREEVLEGARAKLPVGRMGEPEEVARVVAFLCSPLASNVAGAGWSVDGGAVPFYL